MKLGDYNKRVQAYSVKVSEHVNQLAFAGMAVAWLFGTLNNSATQDFYFPSLLAMSILLLACTLICNLFQYIVGHHIWKKFHEEKERDNTITNNTEIRHPRSLTIPIYTLYYAKIVTLLFAYLFISIHIIKFHICS
jgi:hypothetical protein